MNFIVLSIASGVLFAGDFPKVDEMRKSLKLADFTKFRSLSASMIQKVGIHCLTEQWKYAKCVQKILHPDGSPMKCRSGNDDVSLKGKRIYKQGNEKFRVWINCL